MLARYQQAIQQYRGRVFSFAFYSLRVREDAEDVTQDVFIRLWQHWRKIDPERQGAWLMRVAHNAVIDHLRKRKTGRNHLPLDLVPEIEYEDTREADPADLENVEFRGQLEDAIGALGDPHRSILIMRDVQGLSYGEIEQSLNLSQSQVKVYLHRARRQLRQNPGLRRMACEQQIITETARQEPGRSMKKGVTHGQ